MEDSMFGHRTLKGPIISPLQLKQLAHEASGSESVKIPAETAAAAVLSLWGLARLPADDSERVRLRLPESSGALSVPRSACIRNSAFFCSMLQDGGPWAESTAHEIDLYDVDAHAAENVLRYLAGGELSLRADNLVSTFQLADRWQVEGLDTRCLELAPLLVSPDNADTLFGAAKRAGLERLSLRIADSAWLWQMPVGGGPLCKPDNSIAWAKLRAADEEAGRFEILSMWHAPNALRLSTESTPVLPVGPFELTLTRTVRSASLSPEVAEFGASLRVRSDPQQTATIYWVMP